MGIKIKAKVTEKGNLKIDELAQTLLDLKPNDEVVVTIKSKESSGVSNDDTLRIPHLDAMYQSLKELVQEAGIDDNNGLFSYVEGNSIVIIGADEDD